MNSSQQNTSTCSLDFDFNFVFLLESTAMLLFGISALFVSIFSLWLHIKSSFLNSGLKLIIFQVFMCIFINTCFALNIAVYNLAFLILPSSWLAIQKNYCYACTCGIVVFNRLFLYLLGFFSIERWLLCVIVKDRYRFLHNTVICLISILIYIVGGYNTEW